MKLKTRGCKACGASLFLSRQDVAEHLTDCERASPETRSLAREWLAAGAPMEARRAVRQGAEGE